MWSLSDNNGIWNHNHLVRKRTLNHLAKRTKWLNCDVSAVCTVHLTVYYYRVTYKFQSESTLYSCPNVKKFLAQCIWSLSGSKRNSNNHLVRVPLQSLILQISHLFRAGISLTLRQLESVSSLWNAYVAW